MKYAEVMALAPRLLAARDAEDYVAGPTMLDELCEKWGLRPLEKRSRMTIYDRQEIDAAIALKKLSRC